MKRGGPLKTRTPLERKTPLRQVSPKKAAEGVSRFAALDRKAAASRTTPMKRARYTGPTTATIGKLEIRCGGFCEYPGCPKPAQDPHHRDERGQGGRGPKAPAWINELANLLAACRGHNDWASNGSPAAARAMGWLIPSGEATPYNTAVLTRHHTSKVLLNDDGGWTPVGSVAA